MNRQETILGTGLSGLVGSRIVELNSQVSFSDISLDTGIDILNLTQLETVFQGFKGDTVIHLAAFTDTNAAWAQRGDRTGLCYRLNVDGTRNIVDLCRKYNKYLIFISTDFVFDGTKTTPYTETDTPNPIEWYGQTKYEAEQIVLSSGLPAAIVRIAFPYRTRFEPKKDIVRKLIDNFKAAKLYPQWTDQIITPTFIDDIAAGLTTFFAQKPIGIFHLVGSSSQSPYDLALTIAKVFGFDQGLVGPSTLAEYRLSQPSGSRPWQGRLAISNAKVASMGIKIKSLTEGLAEVKKQLDFL